MAMQNRATVVGVFEDRAQADRAVAALRQAGFRDDQIGVAMRHTEDFSGTAGGETRDHESHSGTGAIAGALTGLGLGALAGLGVLSGVIPVIGPAIAAGTLGVILSNAAVGAGVVGLVGALVGAGVPEHEAKYYEGEFQAGRTIVTVTADGRADEAEAILRQYGAYDMKNRSAAANTGFAADTLAASQARAATSTAHTTPASTSATARTSATAGDTIEVKEERLHAEKRPVEAGEVRVRKEVHTENKTIEVPVEREEVVIERRPVGDRVAPEGITADDLREGEEIRIPVREEQVQVHKEAVVTEEVNVGKKVVHDTERVSGQVRKEEVHVEREGNANVRRNDADPGSR